LAASTDCGAATKNATPVPTARFPAIVMRDPLATASTPMEFDAVRRTVKPFFGFPKDHVGSRDAHKVLGGTAAVDDRGARAVGDRASERTTGGCLAAARGVVDAGRGNQQGLRLDRGGHRQQHQRRDHLRQDPSGLGALLPGDGSIARS
jgi:hypothetical protein